MSSCSYFTNRSPFFSLSLSLCLQSTPTSHMEIRDSRFPSICSTPDSRSRPANSNRLTKPKPLPKEMLYGK